MAKKFLTHINLSGNQLLNAALQPSAFAPNAMAAGQIYYSTTDGALYFSTGTGTGNWHQLATGTTSVASLNSFTGPVTLNGTTNNITVDNTNNVITLNIGSNVVTLSDIQTLTNKTLTDAKLGNNLDANSKRIINLATPTAGADATTKQYVDDAVANASLNIHGTNEQITVNDSAGSTTISLPSIVRVDNEIKVGTDTNNPIINLNANAGQTTLKTELYIQDGSGNNAFTVDNATARVNFYDGAGNNTIRVQGNQISDHNGNGIQIYANGSNTANLDLGASQDTSLGAGASLSIYANDNGQGGDVNVSGSNINLNSPTSVNNSEFFVKNGAGQPILEVNPNDETVTIKGMLKFLDQYASFEALEQVNGNTDFQIAADYSIRLNSSNGGIYLEPSTWAYVNNDEIVTRNTAQVLTNKTIADNLHFDNGQNGGTSSIGANGNDLNIVSNAGNVNITSNNANIVLNPDGWAYITSAVAGNEIVTTAAGQTLSNKTISESALGTSLNANQQLINNLADPIDPQDAANKRYVDSAVAGLTWKQAVNLLATSNVPLTGSAPLTIDGQTVDDTYRVLLTGQTTATEDGIYVAAVSGGSYTLTRSTDGTNDELKGAAVFVEEGSQYGTTSWIQTNHYISGFAGQIWVQFSGSGTYTAGSGLELDGTVFNFNPTVTGGLNNNGSIKIANGEPLSTDANGLHVLLGEGLSNVNGQIAIQDGYTTRKVTASLTKANSANAAGLEWDIEHNLNSLDIMTRVYQTSAGADQYADLEVDVIRNSENEVKIQIAQPLDPAVVLGLVVIG